MQSSISLHVISALVIESIFYGLYLCSCGYCLFALLVIDHPCRWRKWSEIRWVMLLAWLILLLNSSLNLALGVYGNLDAFVFSNDPELGFRSAGTWLNLTKHISLRIQPLVGDLVLIYRSYVVYSRQYIVLIPSIIFWIANLAVAARAVHLQATVISDLPIKSKEIAPWIVAFWTLTVCQTLYTTSLIIYRLWRVDHANQEHGYCSAQSRPGKSRLQKVIRTVAESGALHTAAAFMVLICQVAKTQAIYSVTAMEIMVVGIAFNLIIIRARHRELEENGSLGPVPTIPLAFVQQSTTRSGATSLHAIRPNTKNPSITGRPHTLDTDATSETT